MNLFDVELLVRTIYHQISVVFIDLYFWSSVSFNSMNCF